jgi:hypothetical protein
VPRPPRESLVDLRGGAAGGGGGGGRATGEVNGLWGPSVTGGAGRIGSGRAFEPGTGGAPVGDSGASVDRRGGGANSLSASGVGSSANLGGGGGSPRAFRVSG